GMGHSRMVNLSFVSRDRKGRGGGEWYGVGWPRSSVNPSAGIRFRDELHGAERLGGPGWPFPATAIFGPYRRRPVRVRRPGSLPGYSPEQPLKSRPARATNHKKRPVRGVLLLTPCSRRDDTRGHRTTLGETERHMEPTPERSPSNLRIRWPRG